MFANVILPSRHCPILPVFAALQGGTHIRAVAGRDCFPLSSNRRSCKSAQLFDLAAYLTVVQLCGGQSCDLNDKNKPRKWECTTRKIFFIWWNAATMKTSSIVIDTQSTPKRSFRIVLRQLASVRRRHSGR